MSLDEQVFNIRFTAKQLSRQHDKLLAQEKKDRANVKKAVEAGDKERARIYAETAIRNKTQALNLVRKKRGLLDGWICVFLCPQNISVAVANELATGRHCATYSRSE